jgi:CMP-N,N'-diacetyllegionaminic acid synthase
VRTYAIIPARAGSKGVTNKNIKLLNGVELMGYSIAFAKTLEVERVFCSTDSALYAEIAAKHGAEVPFLRSESASSDTAMEQDILKDLEAKFVAHRIPQPDLMVWLRPTFVFRDRGAVMECVTRLMNEPTLTSCRVVTRAESRLYTSRGGLIEPVFDDRGKSMVRRQDVPPAFRVYSTDVFRSCKGNHGVSFLGDQVGYVEAPKLCSLDIDDSFDFALVEALLECKRDLVKAYLPPSLR